MELVIFLIMVFFITKVFPISPRNEIENYFLRKKIKESIEWIIENLLIALPLACILTLFFLNCIKITANPDTIPTPTTCLVIIGSPAPPSTAVITAISTPNST